MKEKVITNRINTNLSLGRYTLYICSVIGMLCGLTVLLTSCDGISHNINSPLGKKTYMDFSLRKSSYESAWDFSRSFNDETLEIAATDPLRCVKKGPGET